jgi:lysophospholipase L1-like esterase
LISAADAASLNVVAAGDSVTACYFPFLSGDIFAGTGFEPTFQMVANGGLKAPMFDGAVAQNDVIHDYVQDTLNANPDVIVFMIGINDFYDAADRNAGYPMLQQYIPAIFERWKTVPRVIVHTVLPVASTTIPIYISPEHAAWANPIIDAQINPVLEKNALEYGYVFWDTNTLLRQQPNWEDYMQGGYGIHPDPVLGSPWLAATLENAIISSLPLPPNTFSWRQGDLTISAPIVLQNNVNIEGPGALTLSAGISGEHDLTVSSNLTAAGIDVNSLTVANGCTVTIQPIAEGIRSVPEPDVWRLLVQVLGAFAALRMAKGT